MLVAVRPSCSTRCTQLHGLVKRHGACPGEPVDQTVVDSVPAYLRPEDMYTVECETTVSVRYSQNSANVPNRKVPKDGGSDGFTGHHDRRALTPALASGHCTCTRNEKQKRTVQHRRAVVDRNRAGDQS